MLLVRSPETRSLHDCQSNLSTKQTARVSALLTGPQWLPPFFRTEAKSLSVAFKASQNLVDPFLLCPSLLFQQRFYNRATLNRLCFVRLHRYTHRSFCSNVPIVLSVRLASSKLFFFKLQLRLHFPWEAFSACSK